MTSLASAMQLGFEAVNNCDPVELRSHGSEEDVRRVIWAAYRQVFGNDHILEAERLSSAESLLKQGVINVREFVRALGQSELYRQKFFYPNPQVRFIELNFKHFLGRAPYDEAEITEHVNLYTQQGLEAEINSYLDSSEYLSQFGDAIVPYCRGFSTQRSQKTVGFNRMFQLYRGAASSDRARGGAQGATLTRELALNLANPIQTPGFGRKLAGTAQGDRNQRFKIRVMQAASNRTPQIRRGMSEYTVAYEQLSAALQRFNQQGKKVIDIAPA
ncbi:phycobilisome linker polypeptide [Lyngbya confervoides]|uniref:Phycobilisome linker polypeptide n=1 Tax=Lyngbya confervoides BDU141951 TaxID=1574623 RepID=A0ABD4T6H8_9CYAN|nr:phycobilisome linker polypeptide [Lyngbya confervoides]MCM1984309.1 phycobilisome linker polypeptide [Lyngbya confervoides BDU141951]